MKNFNTCRNIFCLNDLINLTTGNSLHRSLMTEQGIRMNAQLSGNLQIALERRCYNSCSYTRQRSQDGSPTSHSRKMHIDSILRGPSKTQPKTHTDTEQLWIISTDGSLTEYICITEIDRHWGSDKTNQGILGYRSENNTIRTIWLRLWQGCSHLEQMDCGFGASDRINAEWTQSGTPETWPSRAASIYDCMTRAPEVAESNFWGV